MNRFDKRVCTLGEGPLWHPTRNQLFWFDINAHRLLSQVKDEALSWQFDSHFSAAGWVDHDHLLLASETGLWRFDIRSGTASLHLPLDAENPRTRSNDGRADPWGGFWIGTMGKQAQKGAGAIYRYHCGTLRQIVPDITISNAICFAPDAPLAYFTDTPTGQIMRQPLDPIDGWPKGPPEVFLDFKPRGLNPDGAVTDAAGNIWIAFWGDHSVRAFDTSGHEIHKINLPAKQPTCPAFGGADLSDLYVTSATQSLNVAELNTSPENGMTFCFAGAGQGRTEPQVIL